MTGEQFPAFIYALIILAIVSAGLFARRVNTGDTLKYALIWIVIFGVGFVVVSFFESNGANFRGSQKTQATAPAPCVTCVLFFGSPITI